MRPGAEGGEFRLLSVHARDVSAAERARFAAAARSVGAGLVLETCHRAEWYGTGGVAASAVEASMPAGGRSLEGDAAARHAIAVAVGLESVVVGEDQVLHQLREAVAEARQAGRLDPTLDRLLTLALRAGRRARSWRQDARPSLADLAVERAQRAGGPVAGRRVLVVGAGAMARLVAGAASAAGARVLVANRTADRGRALAQAVGGDVAPFDPGARIGDVAAVVLAIRGPWSIAPATAEALLAGGAVVVDLSAPPAVDGGLVRNLASRLVSVDDLARGPAHEPDARQLARMRALVADTLAELVAWRAAGRRRDAARALAERAEREREAELAELWRRLPNLEPASRDAVDRMSRHLAERLLREPLERLGDDRDGRHERAVRELWAL